MALAFYPDVVNDRLRFGEPQFYLRRDRRRSIAGFEQNQIFAYVRWRVGDFGTREWSLFVCRSGGPNEQLQKIRGIRPGAEILLSVFGKTKVTKILALIDALEAKNIQPSKIPASYWRVVSNTIQVGKSPITYSTVDASTRRIQG